MQPYHLTIITPPAVEPVDFEGLRDHMSVTGSEHRDVIVALGIAGREYVEGVTRRTYVNTTYEVSFDEWCDFTLPRGPVSSVSSVKYTDANGTEQTLPTTAYKVDIKYGAATVRLLNTYTTDDIPNAIRIRFVAGMGADATNVPEGVKLLIKTWTAAQFENREAVLVGKTATTLPHSFDALLTLYSFPGV